MLNVKKLNQLMDKRGIGPGDLAGAAKISYDVVYRLRATDRQRPSAEIIAKLARALETSVDYLLDMTDDPAPSPKTMPREMVDIVKVVEGLSPNTRRQVLVIVDALLRLEQDNQKQLEADLETAERLSAGYAKKFGRDEAAGVFEESAAAHSTTVSRRDRSGKKSGTELG